MTNVEIEMHCEHCSIACCETRKLNLNMHQRRFAEIKSNSYQKLFSFLFQELVATVPRQILPGSLFQVTLRGKVHFHAFGISNL